MQTFSVQICDLPPIHAPPSRLYKEQGAQKLKAFAFGVIQINDEHAMA